MEGTGATMEDLARAKEYEFRVLAERVFIDGMPISRIAVCGR